jgi:phospholipid/cholesterol/gamma-HCH transport system substrate-binding protein
MKSLSPEIRVGLLTIATIVALTYLSLKTAGVSFFGGPEAFSFTMNFGSVAGVELRSKVKLSGVEIGYIEDITLEDGYASIKARLSRKASIRKNAVATIRTSGLLGEQYIEIIQGSKDQPFIKGGDILEHTQEPADMSDIINKVGEAMEDIRSVTSSLKNVFGTLEGENSLKNILHNIDEASANMKVILSENRKALKTTLGNFAAISEAFSKNAPTMAANLEIITAGLKEIIEDNKESLKDGIANVRDLTADFSEIIRDNRKNLKITIDNMATASAKIDDMMDSIKKAGASVERVTSKIERGEGTIGKLLNDEEVYDNLNKTLKGAGKFLNKADQLRLSLGFRGEYQSETDEAKAFFSLKLEPREDKFYLLEVSEDVRRVDDLTTTRNTLNSLLYTVVIGKRFSDVVLRAGLIESSAGAGVDLYLFGDKLMASAEMFNLSGYDGNTDNAQVKAQLKWNAHKYVFFYLGGDELLNEYYRTFLLGGGIMFDENDLKMAAGLR